MYRVIGACRVCAMLDYSLRKIQSPSRPAAWMHAHCIIINEIRIKKCNPLFPHRICHVRHGELQRRSEMSGREKDRTSEVRDVQPVVPGTGNFGKAQGHRGRKSVR